jgi:nucleoside phosphorylase
LKVLVTFAVLAEFAPWRTRHEFRISREAAGPDAKENFAFDARLGESNVRVLLTGMGGQSTFQRVSRALQDAPDFCISSGLAGGLSEVCRVGDVVVARRICRAGNDLSIASSEYLLQAAYRCGAKPVNRSVTVDRIVSDSMQKRSLASSGDMVEMESYFVLRAAVGVRVPSVAIRAISDAWDEDLPLDFNRVLDSRGAVRMQSLVGELAREPRRIPKLVRFGMSSRRAARALADFLDRYLHALSHDPHIAESAALREVVAI